MKNVLITGAAGFIGFHAVRRLLNEGYRVAGIDNINKYYDVELKYGRLAETGIDKGSVKWGKAVRSKKHENYTFYRINLEDGDFIENLFSKENFDYIIHLAAQAGVRYSLVCPHAYIDSNVKGFMNILEACRRYPPAHLVYASTSSVYGTNTKMPFSEHDNADHPASLYAATKKANELMAHSYSHLYNIHATGIRFFTVYGPWGRPDMALFLFTKALLEGKPIEVFNNGDMLRDFTYIDDIIENVYRIMLVKAEPEKDYDAKDPDPASSSAPYRIYNIGNSKPERLTDFIDALQEALGKKAVQKMMPMQAGDMHKTWADMNDMIEITGFKPKTKISQGIKNFVEWYKDYYNVNKH